LEKQQLSRIYIQPQWIYDCVNARMLLPVADYYPGAMLPPHLSPFVEETSADYIPPEKLKLLEMQGADVSMLAAPEEEPPPEKPVDSNKEMTKASKKRKKATTAQMEETVRIDSDDEVKPLIDDNELELPTKKRPMQVKEGKADHGNVHKRVADRAEEKRLQEMLIAKKHRRAYQKIKFGQKRKAKEVRKLKEKRKAHEETTKSAKRIK